MALYNFTAENNGIPLYVQLKQAIISDIKTGKYDNMQKLPSRRALAKELGISTTTVSSAYCQLVDEGYAVTIDRSGFYIKSAADIYNDYNNVVWEADSTDYVYNLSYNNCDTSNIRGSILSSIEKLIKKSDLSCLCNHGSKQGEAELRAALSKFLYSSRNINCSAGDIIIGSGIQQLLTVITMILGNDKVYGFENPTDYKMYIWLKNLGIDIRLVDIGIDTALTPETLDKLGIDVMLVMPENQLPTGRRMSKEERLALASWCAGKDKYIIEAATDGNLNYSGRRTDTIYSLSKGNNVLYLEGFEFTISPNIKTSFMVLPNGFINSAVRKLEMYSPMVTILEQRIYCDMINSGLLEKLIKKNNKTMKAKLSHFISCLENSKLSDRLEFLNTGTGMNFIAKFKSDKPGLELTRAAINNDVKVFEMTKFLLRPNPDMEKNAFVFGYAGLNIPEIEKTVEILEEIWT